MLASSCLTHEDDELEVVDVFDTPSYPPRKSDGIEKVRDGEPWVKDEGHVVHLVLASEFLDSRKTMIRKESNSVQTTHRIISR